MKLSVAVPAWQHIAELFHTRKALVARFVATSLGRTLLVMASILLIREFLVGALGEEAGLASLLAEALGRGVALSLVAFLLVLSYVASSLLFYDNQVVRQRIVKVVELGLMERLIRHLMSLSVPFYDRQSPGDFIQAVRQDVSRVRGIIMAYASLFMEAAVAVGLLAAAISISPTLSFWAFVVLPVAALPVVRIARKTRARSLTVRSAGYILFDVILEILSGIRVIKTYQGEESEAQVTIGKAREYFDELIEMTRVQELSNVVLESLAGLSIAFVIILGGFQVLHGTLSWPALLAFLMAVRAAQGPVNNLNSNFMQIQRLSAAAVRIGELFDEKPEIAECEDAIALDRAPGRIALDNVSFSYGGRLVLKDLSFEILAGETIGVAGPSGAGKTTLLNLIARFYDPTSGVVRFDARDLRDFRIADVYSKLAIVTQAPFLFSASVRDNIRCGRASATDREVEAAAEIAGIHGEILDLPNGYETTVGVGGREISGGQAQRINVARALLKNAPILLLDEATSSLDSISEATVQRAIERLMEGRTSVIVAHRLSTLRHADRIIVLEDGEVVGIGPHEELLHECPLYRRMWETQQLSGPVAEERQASGSETATRIE